MKEEYENLEIEVIEFQTEDIITNSCTEETDLGG